MSIAGREIWVGILIIAVGVVVAAICQEISVVQGYAIGSMIMIFGGVCRLDEWR